MISYIAMFLALEAFARQSRPIERRCDAMRSDPLRFCFQFDSISIRSRFRFVPVLIRSESAWGVVASTRRHRGYNWAR